MWRFTLITLLFVNFRHSFGNNNGFRSKREDHACVTSSGEPGACIVIINCDTLYNLLKGSRNDPDVRKHLVKSQCGYEQRFPKVCCEQKTPVTTAASTTITTTTTTTSSTTTTTTPATPPLQKTSGDNYILNHLPSQCGLSNVTTLKRIVGGRPSTLRAWPWMALLGYTSRFDIQQISWKCGGVLVTARHVVSAAHCFADKVITVRLGDLDISTTDDKANHIDVPVDRMIQHPDFNKVQRTADIGIVVLRESVNFNPDIQPICLPSVEPIRTKSFTGFRPYIAGWGYTETNGGEPSNHLMEAQVTIKTTEECNETYASLGKVSVVIDHRVICAGGGKQDSCKGDSGGPLMISQDGLYYVLGIVSYGHDCGVIGYPGVYTRVSEFVDWIAANTAT